jgi:hypothetical protein
MSDARADLRLPPSAQNRAAEHRPTDHVVSRFVETSQAALSLRQRILRWSLKDACLQGRLRSPEGLIPMALWFEEKRPYRCRRIRSG